MNTVLHLLLFFVGFHVVFCGMPIPAEVYDHRMYETGSSRCETIYAPLCDSQDAYASLHGRCNNLKRPTWGAADTVLRRLLPAEYDDKVGLPRQTGKNRRLPLPRVISNTMKESKPPVSSHISHMHVLFGQLLAHDIVHTPMVKTRFGKSLDCDCEQSFEECVNIELPPGDPRHEYGNRACMPLARSKAAVSRGNCRFKYREQTTTMSSYIDGTFLYGKSDQEAADLRDPLSKSGELLLIRSPYGGPHKNLPRQSDMKNKKISSTIDCDVKVRQPENETCFVSGDVRVGENMGLTAIQTAFARYHNWVARGLKAQNPQWNSDKAFFEARRILAAILQSITFREYLPPLVGPNYMKRFGLTLTDHEYWNGYDSQYDASISNEFTTAAFRYGHSQVAAVVNRPTKYFNIRERDPVLTSNSFFNNKPIVERNGGGSGSILRGFMIDRAETTDTHFVDALREQLFTPRGKPFGKDLLSINIQRGRDHGISGYNDYREFCGLERAASFSDLRKDISLHTLKKLQLLYNNVDDVDLYVGGLAENHVQGGVVGPTFACILSYTMRGLRRGDRFWHELKDSNHPFTPRQLQSIRQVGLASIFCQTGEDMKYVLNRPLLHQHGKSGFISSCGNVKKLDLRLWGTPTPQFSSTFPSNHDVEWTSWFVTDSRNDIGVNVRREFTRIKAIRPKALCNDFAGWKLRYVRTDVFVQISFSCKAGTIAATDFPFQASAENRWTAWIEKQSVKGYEFSCRQVVAIQAKTVTDGVFALETGDVLDTFGPDGFSCKDRHQLSGQCHRYKVRALCSRDNDLIPPTRQTASTIAVLTLPNHVRRTSNLLCQYYNICCGNIRNFYTVFIPFNIRQAARNYCTSYNVCCDA